MKPLRSDGARNRDLILAAAAEVFARDGFNVPLDRIAQTAGVGRATLYRNFPNREALGLAVFGRNVSRFETLADRVPLDGAGFRVMLGALAADMADHAALGPALVAVGDEDDLKGLRARVVTVLDRYRVAAIAAGTLRADITTTDLSTLLGTLGMGLGAGGGPDRRAMADRVVSLLFDGLGR